MKWMMCPIGWCFSENENHRGRVPLSLFFSKAGGTRYRCSFRIESAVHSSTTLHSHRLLASVSAPMSLSPWAISHFQWSRQGAEARLATPAPWGPIIRSSGAFWMQDEQEVISEQTGASQCFTYSMLVMMSDHLISLNFSGVTLAHYKINT